MNKPTHLTFCVDISQLFSNVVVLFCISPAMYGISFCFSNALKFCLNTASAHQYLKTSKINDIKPTPVQRIVLSNKALRISCDVFNCYHKKFCSEHKKCWVLFYIETKIRDVQKGSGNQIWDVSPPTQFIVSCLAWQGMPSVYSTVKWGGGGIKACNIRLLLNSGTNGHATCSETKKFAPKPVLRQIPHV